MQEIGLNMATSQAQPFDPELTKATTVRENHPASIL
jgi:hypothetical protein